MSPDGARAEFADFGPLIFRAYPGWLGVMRCTPFAMLIWAATAVSCGGSNSPSKTADDEEARTDSSKASGESDTADEKEVEAAEEPDDGAPIPTKCAKTEGGCYPSMEFVKRLCDDSYPGVALVMFSGGTPWKRAYVAVREVEPVNAFGGVAGGDKLTLDEEVLVLFEKAGGIGEMTVSGSGSYLVLRWNGTCATLASGELRDQTSGKKKNAKVHWRYIDDSTQSALRKDSRIVEAVRARKKECKGATMGTVSAKCEKYDRELTETIVDVVRSGSVELPVPDKVP